MDKQKVALWIFLIVIFALLIVVFIRQETLHSRHGKEISRTNQERIDLHHETQSSLFDNIISSKDILTGVVKSESEKVSRLATRNIQTTLYDMKLRENIVDRTHEEARPSPTICTLIPIYNGEEYLEDSLRSVFEQVLPPDQVIIGINGHPKYSDVFVHVTKTVHSIQTEYEKSNIGIQVLQMVQPGKVKALNEMVMHTNCEYVALLDVDDIWLPTKLEQQVDVLQTYDIDVIGTHTQYFGDSGIVPNLPKGFISAKDIFFSNPLINSSVLMKKEYAHWSYRCETGLEDYDMWLRLFLRHGLLYNVGEVLTKHRIHNDSFFNTDKDLNTVKLKQLKDSYVLP